MAQGESKQIKFTFSVDNTSAQNVERVLDRLIAKSKELGKALSGGLGGGSLLSGRVGGKPPSAGGARSTASTQNVSFSGVIGQNADAFKKLAQDGTNTMTALGTATQKSVSAQQREISKLQQSLDALAKTYDRVVGSASVGPLGQGIQGRMAGLQQRIGKGVASPGFYNQSGTGLLPGIPYPTATGSMGGMTGMSSPIDPGFQARAAGLAGILQTGGGFGGMIGGIRGGINQMGSMNVSPQMAQALGMVPGGQALTGLMRAGPAAAMAGAGMYLGSNAARGWYNSPTAGMIVGADIQGTQDTYARKLRSGDYSDARSQARLAADPLKQRQLAQELGQTGSWTDAIGAVASPLLGMGSASDKTWEGALGFAKRAGLRVSAAAEAAGHGQFGEVFQGTEGAFYQKQQKERSRAFTDLDIKEQGLMDEIRAESFANAESKVGLQRALGIGNREKTPGNYRSSAQLSVLANPLFSAAEQAAAFQGASASGTRSAAYGLKGGVLQAGAAGIQNAASMAGIMSRSGGATSGNAFMDLVRSQAAVTDATTAGMLGGVVSGIADRGLMAQFTGAGTLGMLGVGAESPIMARQNVKGMGAMDELYGGKRDSWQTAANFMGALNAAPDAGYAAQSHLSKMTSSHVAEVAARGAAALTPAEKAMGITPEMVMATSQNIKQTDAYRVTPNMFKEGSDLFKMSTAMRGGTSAKDYALGAFGGKNKKLDSADEKERAITNLSTLFMAGDPNMGEDTARGKANLELFGEGALAKKGRMVGDVAGKSREADELRTKAEKEKIEEQVRDATTPEDRQLVQEAGKVYARLINTSGNISLTTENIAAILKQFSEALSKAAGNVRAGSKTGSTAVVEPKK